MTSDERRRTTLLVQYRHGHEQACALQRNALRTFISLCLRVPLCVTSYAYVVFPTHRSGFGLIIGFLK
jgi:hypothetical protein